MREFLLDAIDGIKYMAWAMFLLTVGIVFLCFNLFVIYKIANYFFGFTIFAS